MAKLKLHPQQEMYLDDHGTVRFRENKVVNVLLRTGKLNLNDLAGMNFSQEDWIQFMQLIGYSVSGFGELSSTPRYLADEMDAQADKLLKKGKKK